MTATEERLNAMPAPIAAAFDLSGKVSLVTGATAGIGLEVARALGQAGSRVVVASRRDDAVARAEEALAAEDIDALGVVADVSDEEAVRHLVARAVDKYGRLDILVNNAGGSFGDTFRSGPLLDMQPDDFLEAYRSNVVSAFLCARSALPHMRDGGGGAIVNVASMAAYHATRGMGAYAATKAALVNVTKTMAAEWAPHVRVNAVAPGAIDTPRTTAVRSKALMARLRSDIRLGRLGRPEDVAAAVWYLASSASSWVTGSVVDLDGGQALS
jgi:7-alpha-hydroxysteroid dehydrogenase